MLDTLASHLEAIASLAPVWGFVLITFFMAVESSFIPFPSEIVMIPAGFLAMRSELSFHSPAPDLAVAFLCGLAGCMAGAYVNYYLGHKLGRPFMHKYCKYFFLKEEALDRAEELFRKYGDMTTFACRLVPVIRQIISIPAGMAGMPKRRFSLFTALGAGIWNFILLLVGVILGKTSLTETGEKIDYTQIVHSGKDMVNNNYGWIILAIVVFLALYILIHRVVMKKSISK